MLGRQMRTGHQTQQWKHRRKGCTSGPLLATRMATQSSRMLRLALQLQGQSLLSVVVPSVQWYDSRLNSTPQLIVA